MRTQEESNFYAVWFGVCVLTAIALVGFRVMFGG